MNDDRFKIFSGTANLPLAENICKHLDTTLGKMKLGRFSDGEIYLQILENVRGADVFVVQPCCYPVDNHLLELREHTFSPFWSEEKDCCLAPIRQAIVTCGLWW